jgi:hypothetical protein
LVKLKNIAGNPFVRLLLFCLGSLALFFPAIGRTFAADDFQVMKRVGMDKTILIRGFFRPLSDITLYFNYLIGGFDPAGYYVFNILIHGVNSFLLFWFCLKWKWTEERDRQRVYALIAALLFLTYPFHNEGIVWVIGRGASLATLFGLASLLILVSDGRTGPKIIWACLLYFIGMSAYEPILLLPLMIFIILYTRGAGQREMLYWLAALAGTLLVHLALRRAVAGEVIGSYGSGFFGPKILQYAGNVFKVGGRLFLPPTENTRLMAGYFIVLSGVLAVILVLFFRGPGRLPGRKRYFGALFFLLSVGCIMPVLSAVSTKTSESDRLLYFPSFFLCCGISFLLVNLVKAGHWLTGAVVVLLTYNVFFLEENNRNWGKASESVREILAVIGARGSAGKIFVVNLPDERDGAFIFRLGLPDALLIRGMDTSRLVIVNHLTRDRSLVMPDLIEAGRVGDVARIAPDVLVRRTGNDSLMVESSGDLPASGAQRRHSWQAGKNDIVLYWNKQQLVPLLFP